MSAEAGPVSKARQAAKNTQDLDAQLEAAMGEAGIDLSGSKPKGRGKSVEAKLKRLPGFSQGVRANASIRMKKLAQPICPSSRMEFELDAAGVPRQVPRPPGDINHQMLWDEYGPGWVEACIEAGHDPWHRTIQWETKEDELEQIEGTDKFRKVGEIIIPHSVEVPNVAQVAITPRHNNGQGAVLKIRNYGFRRLKDIGYREVCEYRNCQKDVDAKFSTRDYGSYCSSEHLVLVVADTEAIILDQVDNPGVRLLSDTDYRKGKRRRETLLRQAAVEAGAVNV